LVADTPQNAEAEASETTSHVPDIGTSLKREAETVIEDEEDGRRFKLRKKTVGGGLGGVYDPGIILIKSKKKEELADIATAVASPSVPLGESSNAPKWSKVQWDETNVDHGVKPEPDSSGASVADEPDKTVILPPEGVSLKTEEQPASSDQDINEGVSSRAEASSATSTLESAGNMFRKRKVPTGTRGRRQI
jgi:WW domain-binding protein 4